jgi:hypothetical protein
MIPANMRSTISAEYRRQIWLGDCTPYDGCFLLHELEKLEIELTIALAKIEEMQKRIEAPDAR